MTGSYTAQDLSEAVGQCGIAAGDVIFVHSNVGYSGRMEGARTLDDLCARTLEAFLQILGPEGTLVLPTFSYSFGSDQPERRYDPAVTPSACGALSEYVRKLPEARRSADPMFSVAAIGRDRDRLASAFAGDCFGAGSFWEAFLAAGGKICNLNFDAGSTFIHYVERELEVPYRQNRIMSGEIREPSGWKPAEVLFYCRDMADAGALPRFESFDALAREAGIVRKRPVGRGSVVVVTADDTRRLIHEQIVQTPDFLIERGKVA